MGNSSANSSCTETSHLKEDDRIALVRCSTLMVVILILSLQGAIISIINLGGAIGSLLAGRTTDFLGRKVTLAMSGVLVVVGTAIQSAAVQGAPWMVIFGRLISGIGYGSFYMAGPVYIAEIAPMHIRGTLTSLVGPTIAMGILTGYITNYLLYNQLFGWRVSRVLACVFGFVYIVGMALMPRTPRWLMLKGRESEAREVLRKTASKLGQEGIESELEDIRQTLKSATKQNIVQEIKLLLKWRNLKRVLLGVALHLLSAACGTAIYFYSEPLFCSLGIVPFVTALVIGGLTLCGTTFTTIFIDKIGRKPMLVGGGLMMFLLTGAAATLVYAFKLEEDKNDVVGYIVVCLVCLFMLVYSSTWYVIPWVVTSEIFPLEGRGVAVSISTALNWLMAYVLTQAFPSFLASIQTFGTLYMISIIDLAAALFFFFLLPETKGFSLEEMDQQFEKSWRERIRISCCFRFSHTRGVDVSTQNGIPKSENNALNGVVMLEDNSVELQDTKQKSDFVEESDKDWGDWERYVTESRIVSKQNCVNEHSP
ncbi:probable metabolite transport protein CsbC isoform X3 [Halichondria panicea]